MQSHRSLNHTHQASTCSICSSSMRLCFRVVFSSRFASRYPQVLICIEQDAMTWHSMLAPSTYWLVCIQSRMLTLKVSHSADVQSEEEAHHVTITQWVLNFALSAHTAHDGEAQQIAYLLSSSNNNLPGPGNFACNGQKVLLAPNHILYNSGWLAYSVHCSQGQMHQSPSHAMYLLTCRKQKAIELYVKHESIHESFINHDSCRRSRRVSTLPCSDYFISSGSGNTNFANNQVTVT